MKNLLIALVLLILPSVSILFQKGYFPIHDDLQTMRQLQMHKCFQDGQIPCRWINDMGYGYGFPLFNFYPPLPYLLGMPFVWMGLSYIDVVKIVGVLGFVAAAAAMYMFGREFWGNKGGLLAAVFFTYAPYRAVNFYVRAAVNEFWASAFFPAILLGIYKIVQGGSKKWIIFLALSFAGLILSHNQMLLVFIPVMAVWSLYWWWKKKSVASLPRLIVSGLWGIGLAAFYFLPVLFEQKYAHVETLIIGYFNYLAHFLDLKQIFININWGYGSSVLGPEDTMSFALGHLHWIVPFVTVTVMVISKKLRQKLPLIIMFIALGLWSLFMTHSKSTFIWEIVKPLEFLQFPWRFMNLSMFLFSFAAAAAVLLPRKILPIIIVGILLLNGNYFQPRAWLPEATDAERFTGNNWYLLTTNGIFDYLPKWAEQPPADPPGGNISIVSGDASAETVVKKTNLQQFTIQAETEAVAQIETYYFPGWRVWLDGQEKEIDPEREELLGRMQVDVPAGKHEIVAKFTNTPLRAVADSVSLLSWIVLVGIIILWNKKLPAKSI